MKNPQKTQTKPASRAGNILALDIGQARIGVARANPEAGIASPLMTLVNNQEFGDRLAEVIDQEQADCLVVGLPRNLDGGETPQTVYVRDFVAKMKINLPVYFQDEALTSRAAEDRLKTTKKRYNKEAIDAMAAAIILEDYLKEGR